MTTWTAIKLFHILAGALWLGGAAMVTFFLMPTARSLGSAAGPVVGHIINVRKLPLAITVASAIALVTGLVMLIRLGPIDYSQIANSVWIFGLSVGSAFGILAFLWGILVQGRNVKKFSIFTSQIKGPPTPDQQVLIGAHQRRLLWGGYVGIILLLISLIGMILIHPL